MKAPVLPSTAAMAAAASPGVIVVDAPPVWPLLSRAPLSAAAEVATGKSAGGRFRTPMMSEAEFVPKQATGPEPVCVLPRGSAAKLPMMSLADCGRAKERGGCAASTLLAASAEAGSVAEAYCRGRGGKLSPACTAELATATGAAEAERGALEAASLQDERLPTLSVADASPGMGKSGAGVDRWTGCSEWMEWSRFEVVVGPGTPTGRLPKPPFSAAGSCVWPSSPILTSGTVAVASADVTGKGVADGFNCGNIAA
mmetsp:Transcript_4345/g.8026  ORF Transcript_4345/g.8026 Transcript_4345/m.8026 type:complete len:256 (-) Transcript_4345:75-842(-)